MLIKDVIIWELTASGLRLLGENATKLATNKYFVEDISMKTWGKIVLASVIVLTLILLAACNLPSQSTATPDDPSLLYTAAAETVSAQVRQTQVATQPVLPTATLAPNLPTNTLAPPTATQAPVNTAVPPTATNVPVPCDRASFDSDITYPDNSEIGTGTAFIKTWRLKNNGTCTWNSSYAIVFVKGDAMGGPASAQFTTGTIAPGQAVDISVNLIAPASEGTYQGYWKLRNASGILFGLGGDAQSDFWVKIKAVKLEPTSTATPKATLGIDFVDKGSSAEWRNTTKVIPWGDPPSDNDGVAVNIDNVKMENNKTYNHLLATYPENKTDGYVRGMYPSYTVVAGDHFRTLLGLRSGCNNAKVRFQLVYKEGATETIMAEWLKICDGNLLTIDQDLGSLVGKSLQFILVLKAEGSPDGDQALWVNPRIER